MFTKMVAICFLAVSLFSLELRAEALKSGYWRFEQEMGHGTVPFVIEFQWQGEKLLGTLHNGKEKIELKDIEFNIKKKELIIPLQIYEQSLNLRIENSNTLIGFHIRHNRSPEIKMKVTGTHGVSEKFPEAKSLPPAQINLSGRWEVDLIDEWGSTVKGIVVFEQKGNELNGSILTSTGDYRYFSGYVSKKSFKTSSYDGVFNYLFEGELNKNQLEAKILANYQTRIYGKKNNKAKLPDAYKQTQLESLDFSFPDLSGKQVSLKDPQFANKPVIVQIYGSWCPNCMDEMNYLIPWYAENKSRGIEIVALAFERSLSPEAAIRQLRKVQDKRQVNYPLLLAGYTSQDKPADKIKGLKNFISFPTTIFLNRKHEVVKVHAGFTGPGTGEFFENWKKEFNKNVDQILKK